MKRACSKRRELQRAGRRRDPFSLDDRTRDRFRHYRDADWKELAASAAPAIARANENNLIYDRQPLEFVLSMAQFEQGSTQAAQEALERVLALAVNFGHEIYAVSARGTLMLYDLYAGAFPKIIREGPRVAEMHRAEKLDVDLFAVLTALATAYSRVGDETERRCR